MALVTALRPNVLRIEPTYYGNMKESRTKLTRAHSTDLSQRRHLVQRLVPLQV